MAWVGIWLESLATEGGARDPALLRGLEPPIVYAFPSELIAEETRRLTRSKDPSVVEREGANFRVYYSLNHDTTKTGLDEQGCRILNWLFGHFETGSRSTLSTRFSEIPVVIHCEEPAKAAAMANALALLRFLAAAEDQAVAKIMVHPWNPFRGSPAQAMAEYQKRVRDFLLGEVFYPDDVDLFDILGRDDLKAHRSLAPCCRAQIGFVEPLLEWIDECWPKTPSERADLLEKVRSSLADEARTCRPKTAPVKPAREFFVP